MGALQIRLRRRRSARQHRDREAKERDELHSQRPPPVLLGAAVGSAAAGGAGGAGAAWGPTRGSFDLLGRGAALAALGAGGALTGAAGGGGESSAKSFRAGS